MGILRLREGRRPVLIPGRSSQRAETRVSRCPSCLLPTTAGCPGLGAHPWDLSPHYLGKDMGAGFALLPVPRESHGSQDSLLPLPLPLPCVLDPQVLPLAWLSSPFSSRSGLRSLHLLTSGQMLSCHQVINMVTCFFLVLSLWVEPNKKHSHTPCSS